MCIVHSVHRGLAFYISHVTHYIHQPQQLIPHHNFTMLRTSTSKAFSKANSFLSLRGFATKKDLDLVVIGAGPGGYVAAIRGAQLGLKTACIDKRGPPGGTCLNVGCIPSKALLNNSQIYHTIKEDTKKRGIDVDGASINFPQFMKAKEEAVNGLTGGVRMLLKKNKIEYLEGTGSFVDENTIKVVPNDGGEEVELNAKDIIIATGSEVTPFPGIEIDEERIVSSTGALSLQEIPKSLTIIGGGIIGLEMASVWSRLGTKVTVVEYAPSIGGAGMDTELSKTALKILKKQGLDFKLGSKVKTATREGDIVKTTYEDDKGAEQTLESDVLLVAVGRRPFTKGLDLEKVGIELDPKGRVIMDQEYRTNKPHIRVIGDATFGPMLAHKAEDEAVAAAEYIKTGYGHVNYNVIPSVMYTHPEFAWVGQTEQELKEAGIKYNVGKFAFAANSRAKTNLETDGFVKVLADKETDRILGVHIAGPNAGEMIGEAGLALEYGASAEDIARTCHAHPTLSEALKEASMAAYGKPINS